MTRPARVLVAMDSFKGTFSAIEASDAVARGLAKAWPESEIIKLPLADGGAGTVDALLATLGGEKIFSRARGPLGESVEAGWGVLGDGVTAVIELAAASGLALVPEENRNPMRTTTHGSGELIAAAIERGCKKVIVGIGDSATVDGGLGACQALGARFFGDSSEITEPITGGHLGQIARMELSLLRERLGGIEIEVLCDVDNPLLGANGAAAVFGPQKGATPEMIAQLEAGLANVYSRVESESGRSVADQPGAGAAGGFGAAALGLLGGRLVSGTEKILGLQKFDEVLGKCDLLVTGEGRMDTQSLRGKGAGRAAIRARDAGKRSWAIVGLPPDDETVPQQLGIERFATLDNEDLEQAAHRMAAG